MSRSVSINNHHHQSRLPRSDNPYQITSVHKNTTQHQHQNKPTKCQRSKNPTNTHHHHHHQNQHDHHHHQPTSIDIGFISDATTTEDYDYYDPSTTTNNCKNNYYRNTFSEDSRSSRLPYFEFDEDSNLGNSFSEHDSSSRIRYSSSSRKPAEDHPGAEEIINNGKIVQQQQHHIDERLYHEIGTPCDNEPSSTSSIPHQHHHFNESIRRMHQVPSRLSERPQSSMSSALTNAMVYGCGGKCQTFESVCYFIFQLFFVMGILIGVSLCIAGLVLRKSAARNLQVLVYIGVMLALISGLLLTIQCRAKNSARRRIQAIKAAKRAPIPLESFTIRSNPIQNNLERLSSIRETQNRNNELPNNRVYHHQQQLLIRTLPPQQQQQQQQQQRAILEEEQEEENGIPWWRRKEIRMR